MSELLQQRDGGVLRLTQGGPGWRTRLRGSRKRQEVSLRKTRPDSTVARVAQTKVPRLFDLPTQRTASKP